MRKHFCAAPWSALTIDPDGLAKPCSISQHKVPLINFNDISTNKKFVEIRQSMIDDDAHPSCTICWQQEQANVNEWSSRRSIYQYDNFHNLDNPTTFKLEYLDLRWSNTCNLNCIYCGPYYSSSWANLTNTKQKFRVNPTLTSDDLCGLKTIQLSGGEPFLIKENFELLSNLLKVNPDVHVEVTSNLTSVKDNKIYNLVKEFKNVTIVASFESVGSQFEYIRHGAKWEDFSKNLITAVNDFKHVQINMVYFPLSSLGIDKAIDFALQCIPVDEIFIVSQQGENLGFDMLSKSALEHIKTKNTQYANQLPDVLKNRLLSHVNEMQTTRNTSSFPQYDRFDQLTNQSHKLIFPELYL